jgi:(p)ppGpp synthase/HD superfamily hydrolase
MSSVESLEQKIVAILHDVVEDSDITLQDLRREGFSEEIVTAVDCLTKREGEPYAQLIARAKVNPTAKAVKLADLRDNMDLRRNRQLKQDDLERLQRYLKGWRELSAGAAA